MQEAIQSTGQILDGLKQDRETLHQQVATQRKQAEETLMELKTHVEEKKASVGRWLSISLITRGGILLVEKLAEYRVDIFLIANMLNRKVIKRLLQMFVLAP